MKSDGATRIEVIPVTLPVANAYITRWHRHHAPLVTVMNGRERLNGGFVWFCIAAVSEEAIVGVSVVGRPPNRHNDDGQTVEVLRLATDGTANAPSALLGASARAAKAMGAARIVTYTLATETGISFVAAGWAREAGGITTSWHRGRGKARAKRGGNTIWRPHMEIEKVRWAKHFREAIDVDVSREGMREYAFSLIPDEPTLSLFDDQITGAA